MIDRTYRNDPYEYMSQEPCDYCPYQNTDKCSYYEDFTEPIPKKKKFYIHDMDITFDKEIDQETMERLFFEALRSIGVIGHRGCPH